MGLVLMITSNYFPIYCLLQIMKGLGEGVMTVNKIKKLSLVINL